ncbi:sigma-70 family RNA polymerase sigma factor [Sorangium sp. So ce176]|uniref:sigma-70 family RNA polymerase sigma factor n=1 Tax=Sorangium sp. So ce176 TaxID=3133286 RepID=UPI003F62AF38
MDAILAERGIVLAMLAGIPKRDRRDVEAEVLLNAWNAIRRGMYRPDPRDKPRDALRKWLHGIAWRLASHFVHSAYVRHVVPHPSPLGLLREPVGVDLHAQIEAREVLDAMASLPPWQVDALLSVGRPRERLGLRATAPDEPAHGAQPAPHRSGGAGAEAATVATLKPAF